MRNLGWGSYEDYDDHQAIKMLAGSVLLIKDQAGVKIAASVLQSRQSRKKLQAS